MRYLKHVVCGGDKEDADPEDPAGGNECPITQIIYCYAIWQPEFNEFAQKGVKFINGFNSPFLTEAYMNDNPNVLLLLDDVAYDAPKQFLSNCFTKFSHHYKWSISFQCHNIFSKEISDARTTALNSTYTVLTSSRRCRDSAHHLGLQVFRGEKDYLNVFKEIFNYMMTLEWGNILVDTHPRQNDNRLTIRMNIFFPFDGHEPHAIFFPK